MCLVFCLLSSLVLTAQESGREEEFPDFGEADELTLIAAPETTAQVKIVSREQIEAAAA
jgi:hypothetical protein